jgi:ribulose-5-phosphate 4-epimerase/fuculose-1-phosphate aldolase
VDKETIEVEHIVAVDSQGRPVDGKDLPPSAETLLHMMLYKTLDAGAVFHTVLSQKARYGSMRPFQGRLT